MAALWRDGFGKQGSVELRHGTPEALRLRSSEAALHRK